MNAYEGYKVRAIELETNAALDLFIDEIASDERISARQYTTLRYLAIKAVYEADI